MTPQDTLKQRDAVHATLEARLRIQALEEGFKEVKVTATSAHTDVTAISERILGITEWQRRQNGDIASMVTAFNNLSTTLGEKLEGVKTLLNKLQDAHTKEISTLKDEINILKDGYEQKLANVCGEYDAKLETLAISSLKQQSADRSKLQWYVIGLMGTIIGGLVIALVSSKFPF